MPKSGGVIAFTRVKTATKAETAKTAAVDPELRALVVQVLSDALLAETRGNLAEWLVPVGVPHVAAE